MNPNSIDYLYQVTSVTDRAPIASRTDESSSGFDDHLSQASSTVFDVIRPTNRTSSASIYTQSNDSSLADQYNSSTAPPASHDDDSTSSSQHSSTDNTRDSTPTAGQPQAQKS